MDQSLEDRIRAAESVSRPSYWSPARRAYTHANVRSKRLTSSIKMTR
jgi:hypothetical protein